MSTLDWQDSDVPWVRCDLHQEQDETLVTLGRHQLSPVAGVTLEIPEDKAQWADNLQELSVEEKGKEWNRKKIPEDISFSPLQKIAFPAVQIKYGKGLPMVALGIIFRWSIKELFLLKCYPR